MQLSKGAMVAVADGEKLVLFRNSGDESNPTLTAPPQAEIGTQNKGSGARHHSSSANPDASQQGEDNFAAGTAAYLNREALDGRITELVIIAAPRTLGELRKHYHKKLLTVLVNEISKDLTGHSAHDVEKTIAAA